MSTQTSEPFHERSSSWLIVVGVVVTIKSMISILAVARLELGKGINHGCRGAMAVGYGGQGMKKSRVQ